MIPRRAILTAASVIALTAAANAADMYSAPQGYKDGPPIAAVYWHGFYAGANGGGAFSAGAHTVTLHDPAGAYYDTLPGVNLEGGFGGGQIGYNWQSSRWVLGVEADIQGGDISRNIGYLVAHSSSSTTKESVGYFGTVRARGGYAFDSALLYATGGLAYGEAKYNTYDSAGALLYKGDSGTQTGYTVGGGVEYKFAPAWSAKVEYQYINLGGQSLTDVVVTGYGARNVETDFHTVRFGLNYHLGSGILPLK